MGRHVTLLTLAAVLAGCQTDWQGWNGMDMNSPRRPSVTAAPAPVGPAQVAAAPRAVPVTAPPAAPQLVLATVNGRAVPLAKLTDILIAAYGLPVARDIIYLELVEQDAQARGVVVTEADVKAEHERTLE